MQLINQSDGSIVLIPQTARDHNFLSYFCEMTEARNNIILSDPGSTHVSKFQHLSQEIQPLIIGAES